MTRCHNLAFHDMGISFFALVGLHDFGGDSIQVECPQNPLHQREAPRRQMRSLPPPSQMIILSRFTSSAEFGRRRCKLFGGR